MENVETMQEQTGNVIRGIETLSVKRKSIKSINQTNKKEELPLRGFEVHNV